MCYVLFFSVGISRFPFGDSTSHVTHFKWLFIFFEVTFFPFHTSFLEKHWLPEPIYRKMAVTSPEWLSGLCILFSSPLTIWCSAGVESYWFKLWIFASRTYLVSVIYLMPKLWSRMQHPIITQIPRVRPTLGSSTGLPERRCSENQAPLGILHVCNTPMPSREILRRNFFFFNVGVVGSIQRKSQDRFATNIQPFTISEMWSEGQPWKAQWVCLRIVCC